MHRQSKLCSNCFAQKRARPENYFRKICPICDEKFTTHLTHINRDQGKYCSRACARKGSPTRKKTAVLLACHTCKKSFYKHKSEMWKSASNLHFCSPNCWYSYNQNENHYSWAGGQNERVNPTYTKWRKAVLERDKRYCRLCHSRLQLEVHHIKRFTTHPDIRWDIDNGITLCHTCHVSFRNREEEYEKELSIIRSVPIIVFYV